MGIDLGALLRGAATGISGYEEGKRKRTEMERQARLDLLKESLERANIQRILAEAEKARRPAAPARPVTVWGDQGLMQYDPESGAFEPARTTEGGGVKRPPAPPGWQLLQNEQGEWVWVPKPGGPGPEGTAGPGAAGAPQPLAGVPQGPVPQPPPQGVVPTGVRGKRPEVKPPTPNQLQDAAYGARGAVAHRTMTDLEGTNLPAVRQAAAAINRPGFARAIPFLGVRSEKAARALREYGLSDDAQQYLNSLIEFSQNAAPGQFTPGAIRSPEILYNMWTEFGVQLGESAAGAAIKQRNRLNFVRQQKLTAGPDAWAQALKEYGLKEDELFGGIPKGKSLEEMESRYGVRKP